MVEKVVLVVSATVEVVVDKVGAEEWAVEEILAVVEL